MITDRIDPPELLKIPEIVNCSHSRDWITRDPHLRSNVSRRRGEGDRLDSTSNRAGSRSATS